MPPFLKKGSSLLRPFALFQKCCQAIRSTSVLAAILHAAFHKYKTTIMKTIFIFLVLLIFNLSCFAQDFDNKSKSVVGDTIKIANEQLEYEVTIIDAGFAIWLNSRAFPRNYHSESFLENKNQFFVSEWNRRVLEPQRFDPNLYEMQINYSSSIHYGYEVNYLIYNYMIYFQNTYRQKLWGYVPSR